MTANEYRQLANDAWNGRYEVRNIDAFVMWCEDMAAKAEQTENKED